MNQLASPFYPGTKLQFAWNSSALGTFKECARKYFYSYIEGWTPKGTGIHLRFGRLFQDALDFFDKLVIQGEGREDAIDLMVDWVLQMTWDGREPDGSGGTPWETGDANKNRETLLRSVVWYVDHYAHDSTSTLILSGAPALELKFTMEFPALTPKGEPYLMTGHMDRLCQFGDDKFIMDRKTTKTTISPYYFQQYSPDNQMSLYTFAGRSIYDVPVAGVIIDAAQIAVGFTSFSRGITTRSEGQISEWVTDTTYWLRLAETFAEANYWPMNDKSCHDYGGCPFREVCNKDAAVRDSFLRTNFVISHESSERILNNE